MATVVATWTASAGTALTYTLYRSGAQGVRGSVVVATTSTVATDNNVVAGQTYWYGVTARNTAGESPLSTQAKAVIPGPPPIPPQAITSFTATPSSIAQGSSSTLVWATTNAVTVTLDGGAVGTSGSSVVSPSATQTYTLAATGTVAPVSSVATVTVVPPSPIVNRTPPAASVTNSDGVWTLAPSTQVLLNGVAVSGGSGQQIESIGDQIALWGGDGNWYQYFDYSWDNAAFHIYGTADPSITAFAVPAPYVGPSNTANIWELELTDYASLTAQAGYSLDGFDHSQVWAFNPQFGVDAQGIHYLRFTNNPDHFNEGTGLYSKLIGWFMAVGNSSPGVGDKAASLTEGSCRFCLWIEDDVAAAFNEYGMKLGGFTSETGFAPESPELFSDRVWHWPPVANTYDVRQYLFAAGTTPDPVDFGVSLQANRWNCFDVHVKLNDIGMANGSIEIKLDGHTIHSQTAQTLRTRSDTLLRSFHVDVYHGGLQSPKSLMHYRIAKLAVSTAYIGVPTDLIPSTDYPAWRVPMTNINTVYQIANTGSMAGNIPLGVIANPGATEGKSSADIEAWGGFAASATSWYGAAQCGHGDGWFNKAYQVDFSADQPQFNLLFIGSPFSQVPTIQQMQDNGYSYYFDNLPAARHIYYGNHYVGSRGRVMLLYASAVWSGSGFCKPTVNGFNLASNTYDAKGTWQDMTPWSVGSSICPTMARHPVTEDVYVGNNSGFLKWSAAAGTWSTLAVPTFEQWLFHGSVIDVARNRWVYCQGATLQFIDLTTLAYTTLAVTGDPTFDADAANEFSALLHILDTDRYWLFTGRAGVTPGTVHEINPVTGAATKLLDITAAINGTLSKATYFEQLGGVAYLPSYASNILFIPTR